MKKVYKIKFTDTSKLGDETVEQIISAKNISNAVFKFNLKNWEYKMFIKDIEIEEVKLK